MSDIVYRLRKRAEIRRQIPDRKSVQEGKSDRIADLLEEAANYIELAEKREPVAYVNNDGFIVEKDFDIAPGEKLYLAPPKREWVGLTDKEIDYIWGISPGDYEDKFAFARAIEDKLKEKNT